MGKMTLEELRAIRSSVKSELLKRDSEGKSVQVIVGMGTCGIAAGAKATLDAFIKEILTKITSEIDRGATLLHAEGGYSRNGKEVILCVIENKQYPSFNKMISEIDPNAFLIVQDAQEVKGDGFTYYSDLRLKTLKEKKNTHEK